MLSNTFNFEKCGSMCISVTYIYIYIYIYTHTYFPFLNGEWKKEDKLSQYTLSLELQILDSTADLCSGVNATWTLTDLRDRSPLRYIIRIASYKTLWLWRESSETPVKGYFRIVIACIAYIVRARATVYASFKNDDTGTTKTAKTRTVAFSR